MRQRIQNLLEHINQGLYEKHTETSLAMLAAIAGESIILLGPPGVAKSMVARRLKTAFCHARSFEYLMSRFSTPDEIFGPVSISRLKTSDEYVRATEGYLPDADVVFLDEIWKAGPAIQNTLLTVMNERLFRNGRHETHIPMKLLIAASNELPAQGEGLEALWDRFTLRIECSNIRMERNFDLMLLDTGSDTIPEPAGDTAISDKEYALWQNDIARVAISTDILGCIHRIRHSIRAVEIEGTDERRDIYISDRRWKHIARLLRTSAYMHDRHMVDLADILPIYRCLWQEPEELAGVRHIVVSAIFAQCAARLADIKRTLKDDIRHHQASAAARRIDGESALPGLAGMEQPRDYVAEIEQLADDTAAIERGINDNMFASADDKAAVRSWLMPLRKDMAFTRQDIAKLYD